MNTLDILQRTYKSADVINPVMQPRHAKSIQRDTSKYPNSDLEAILPANAEEYR